MLGSRDLAHGSDTYVPLAGVPALPEALMVLLVTDLEAFTTLIVRLGDLEAQRMIRAHNVAVRGACGSTQVWRSRISATACSARFVRCGARSPVRSPFSA